MIVIQNLEMINQVLKLMERQQMNFVEEKKKSLMKTKNQIILHQQKLKYMKYNQQEKNIQVKLLQMIKKKKYLKIYYVQHIKLN